MTDKKDPLRAANDSAYLGLDNDERGSEFEIPKFSLSNEDDEK